MEARIDIHSMVYEEKNGRQMDKAECEGLTLGREKMRTGGTYVHSTSVF